MKGQVAVVLLVINFTGTDRFTYQKNSNARSKVHELSPPRGGKLYLTIDGHSSEALRKALVSINVPKSLLCWALYREHGVKLDDNWLEAHPPPHDWNG